eukprot:3330934-Ditylum_brightwellii.AAC.1
MAGPPMGVNGILLEDDRGSAWRNSNRGYKSVHRGSAGSGTCDDPAEKEECCEGQPWKYWHRRFP